MDEKVIIEFAKWITGHDEETIIQMYDDWASSPARQAIQVQAKVKPACENKEHRCRDCNRTINEGEASVFGVCDDCWDTAMRNEKRFKTQ